MTFALASLRRRGFLVPADLLAGLFALAVGGWLLGATWNGPLALAGAAGVGGCWLVGARWVWDAVRSPRAA